MKVEELEKGVTDLKEEVYNLKRVMFMMNKKIKEMILDISMGSYVLRAPSLIHTPPSFAQQSQFH